MKEMEQVFRILKKYQEYAEFSGGATKEKIRQAQMKLGISFPGDYRDFLSAYGAGSIGGCEIYGITESEAMEAIPNGMWLTAYLRKHRGLPGHLLPVAFDGFGGFYCIDTKDMDEQERYPVVLFSQDQNDEKKLYPKCADSFASFFLQQLKLEIDRLE